MTRAAIYLRPFEAGDADRFALRADCDQEFNRLAASWDAPFNGRVWTLERCPGQVLGFGGAVFHSAESAQAFAFLADVPRGDWPLVLGCARIALGHLERAGFKRITTLVREDWPQAEATLERLGFTRSAEVSDWPGYRVMAKGG